MAARTVVALLLLAASLAARAEVYRWVDENGKTHYGEVVPEKYKQKSKRVDGTGPEVSGAQRQEAADRAAREKARLDALQRSRDAKEDAAQAGSGANPAAPTPSECQELMQKYDESERCFAPYRTAKGIRAEAFERCKPVQQPIQCLPSPPGPSERTYLPSAPDTR